MSIVIGNIVYHKRKGWSGVPMRVLELNEVMSPTGPVTQAVCTNINGLYSDRHKVRVKTYAVDNLTIVPDSARK